MAGTGWKDRCGWLLNRTSTRKLWISPQGGWMGARPLRYFEMTPPQSTSFAALQKYASFSIVKKVKG